MSAHGLWQHLGFVLHCLVRLSFAFMGPASDSEIIGVDILQYPVESEVNDVIAPSPSAIPLPSFGCQ